MLGMGSTLGEIAYSEESQFEAIILQSQRFCLEIAVRPLLILTPAATLAFDLSVRYRGVFNLALRVEPCDDC